MFLQAMILVEQLMQNHSWLIAGLGDGAGCLRQAITTASYNHDEGNSNRDQNH
jgi:hypothetical protein